jgi:uncharacterized membrane protein YadS
VQTLEQLEAAAHALGLPTFQEGSELKVRLDSQSCLLSGVWLRIRTRKARTTATIRWGSLPAWYFPFVVLPSSIPMVLQASLSPFNDASKFLLAFAVVAIVPTAVTNLVAWRVKQRLFQSAFAP